MALPIPITFEELRPRVFPSWIAVTKNFNKVSVAFWYYVYANAPEVMYQVKAHTRMHMQFCQNAQTIAYFLLFVSLCHISNNARDKPLIYQIAR